MAVEKILIIGSGGREHAIANKLRGDQSDVRLFIAPGNPGTAEIGTNIDIPVKNISELTTFAKENDIGLTVVGPEAPLAEGVVNAFVEDGLPIFGPTRSAARLETDKAFAVQFMQDYNIPHPESRTFSSVGDAHTYIEKQGAANVVIKAVGLAQGKGVFLPDDEVEAVRILDRLMVHHELGDAGERVVIQERLKGPEISMLAFSDGTRVVPLLPAQDHKRLYDRDEGPNTGGMGAVAGVPFVKYEMIDQIQRTILQPSIDGMRAEGHPYKGVLYAGLMMTSSGPKVLEFNARFGDPETQPLMMLMNTQLAPVLLSCIEGTLTESQVRFTLGKAACVVLASEGYPDKPVLGREIFGLDTVNDPNVTVFHAGTIMSNGRLVTHGGRVLGVTAYGKTLPEALKRAYAVIGSDGIHFDGMQYREDIGDKAMKKS